ncbi:restriction endonuclease subunit S [Methylobacter sp. G7]|uniref:restriction endonuclease subunit S n=1 Tax=Methylobacter sp. G7 TaxID=3230117 RepID=UPI003D809E3F
MSADWPVVRLGDFCAKVGSGSTPNGGANVYIEQGDICLIRSQNVHNDGFKPNGLVYITQESADKLKNVVVEENDILLNITGDSVARVCLAKNEYIPARVNQHVAIIRPDPEKFDSRYLRYLLVSPTVQDLLLSIASIGATRNALTKGMIESLEVCKPPISIQKSIADNLEILDLKIDINTQTNQTLEAIAQAVFKSWFVDFEPVKAKMAVLEAGGTAEEAECVAICAISGKDKAALIRLQTEQPDAYAELAQTAALFPVAMQDSELGEIPEGWNTQDFSKFAQNVRESIKAENTKDHEIYIGLEHIDRISLTLRRWGSGGDIGSNKSAFIKGDVLFGKLRPYFHKVSIAPINGICSTDILVIRPKRSFYSAFVILQTFSPNFVEHANLRSTGTRMPRASWNDMANYVIASPNNDDVFLKFNKRINPLLNSLSVINSESITLAELRDNLLPKLLSGEIDLSQAVKVTDEVSV